MASTWQKKFDQWNAELEREFYRDLTFPEVRRSAQALSNLYVHKREKLKEGHAFGSKGKRAAYALYFSPLHAIAVRQLILESETHFPKRATWLDLGCGTGACSIGLWLAGVRTKEIIGLDRSGWAVQSFQKVAKKLALPVTVHRGRIEAGRWPKTDALIAGWAINEMSPSARKQVADQLRARAEHGAFICLIEPIAKKPMPWWESWLTSWAPSQAQIQEWALPLERPPSIEKFDQATRLDHRTLKIRTVIVPN